MKQMKIWGLLFALILATHTLHADAKRYEIQSGIIEYTTNGGGNMMGIKTQIDGKSKTLFKEWGKVELHDETSKSLIMGREESTHQTTKIDHDKVYIVDYAQKSIAQYDHTMLMQSQYKDLAKNPKEMMLSMGGAKTGEESLLGYDCEIWETQQIKLWLYKGIILKSVTNMMGLTHTTEATNIQMDVSVSDEELQLPDFPIKTMQQNDTPSQMPQMTPEQIQQMKEMMKNFSQK
jgi:hypothetical protein